ncbi:MAG: hypothetical protein CVU71_06580 [Deltaproteobacteria bacterium HGW-Deltaproteobacteria-6]|nr:MAG: hypothetical protein CVU71_06580 [Deltaproteobacteria bacterium HGW-Deltaproteobacteria-6]
MTTTDKFSFQEIGIVATIATITGHTPDLSLQSGESLARFCFPDTPEIRQVAMAWAAGTVTVNAVQFEKNRAALYRRIRALRGC